MKFSYVGLLFIVLVTAGCTNGQNNEANNDEQIQTQPIHYETREEQNERLGIRNQTIGEKGGYPQSEQKEINRGDNTVGENTDIFTSEQSKVIADHLTDRRDIKAAQVAITDEKIVVAVMLSEYTDDEIGEKIEKEVRTFDQNKTIVVYTDSIYWDRMNNLKSGLKRSESPNEIKEDMEWLFNPGRDQ
ncbi:YhcN/YlaJ family sporulation lipoprotein [Virgibacillus necropolis]|uniref:Sporulation protein n=1 Tax=Virgibacillus necropolis TaxID=163877 RepID=A0A221MBU6_9BACI|nr:YhcN/YlaJ family sporulation lipoprotein [Virgibacillus necropolis]ASN05115.1 hypothetical protein CFK40_08865 [Virgibacillus necropolis]